MGGLDMILEAILAIPLMLNSAASTNSARHSSETNEAAQRPNFSYFSDSRGSGIKIWASPTEISWLYDSFMGSKSDTNVSCIRMESDPNLPNMMSYLMKNLGSRNIAEFVNLNDGLPLHEWKDERFRWVIGADFPGDEKLSAMKFYFENANRMYRRYKKLLDKKSATL